MARSVAVLYLAVSLAGCAGATGARVCGSDEPPFTVAAGLFDQAFPQTLGLNPAEGSETFTIFRPARGDNAYNHGVVLVPFKGRLYAQWQTSRQDEDSSDTHVVFSVSDDGESWSEPAVLAPEWSFGYRTSGGWWTDGETLIAFINEWPASDTELRAGYTRFLASADGNTWSAPADVTAANGERINGVIEQDPLVLSDGRIIGAFHGPPGLKVSPWYTDAPLATSGWRRGKMENLPYADSSISRELEPSAYIRRDGAIVMVFRDQASSFRKLASVSCDRGEHWSRPVVTSMPDARTKQSAGNLPDGTAYLAGNPVGRPDRYPLALALSRNGHHFDRALLLRGGGAELPPLRFPGRYKRIGYSYPKSIVWRGYLYVAYATNKEAVELTRLSLKNIP